MELKDYFHLFTEEELTLGAELYFSGDIREFRIKKIKADTVSVSGRWTSQEINKKAVLKDCNITLDPGLSLICTSKCSCEAFEDVVRFPKRSEWRWWIPLPETMCLYFLSP